MYGNEFWVWMKRYKRRITAWEIRYLQGDRDCVRNTLVYDCEFEKNVIKIMGVSRMIGGERGICG